MSLQFHTHLGFPALRTIRQGRGGNPSLQPPEGEEPEGCWTSSSRSPAGTQDNTFSRGQTLRSFPGGLWVYNMCICCALVLEMDGLEIQGEPVRHGASVTRAATLLHPILKASGTSSPEGLLHPKLQDLRLADSEEQGPQKS